MNHRLFLLLLLVCAPLAAQTTDDLPATSSDVMPALLLDVQAMSLLGEPLRADAPSAETLQNLAEARAAFEANPGDIDALIWMGRRQAYAGDYRGAIETYTRGIETDPADARLYRHRGHRYITVRDFDRAIADLEYAAQLVDGQPDMIEPDGLPNAQGIPVSSLHTNIWYHLGLAYYLKQDWPNALRAFQAGFDAGRNDDNRVSTTHWRYMILRRMGRDAEATQAVAFVSPDLDVIENHVYHRLCLFYAGLIPAADITEDGTDNPTNSAAAYGLANWAYYNGNEADGLARMRAHLASDSWAAFGYLAAEADLAAEASK